MRIHFGFYTIYAVLVFGLHCLVFVPVMMVLAQKTAWHHLALRLHNWWAASLMIFLIIPVKVEWRYRPHRKERFILCANHFSFLDIPVLCLLFRAKFIGKSSIARVPLFGYFYSRIHITVNRASVRSRAESLAKSRRAVDEGFNLAIFPEGGVLVKPEDIPAMVPFRDGAFTLSMEKNLPILPVTLLSNHLILPDQLPLQLFWHPCRMVVHPPVFPKGNSEEELARLKKEVFEVIQTELNQQLCR